VAQDLILSLIFYQILFCPRSYSLESEDFLVDGDLYIV
jgi:hypothetical protein